MRSLGPITLVLAGCGGNVTNERDAEIAYLGLDGMVSKAMGLGLDGFNAADSANIADQQGEGDLSGTLVVGGQVDQGASDNKGMRLDISLDEYADEVFVDDDDNEVSVTYWTLEDDLPTLELQLKDMPDGTLSGTLLGTFEMDGDLVGDMSLDLSLDGLIEDDGSGGVQRVADSVRITGTATSDYGTYEVDLTR